MNISRGMLLHFFFFFFKLYFLVLLWKEQVALCATKSWVATTHGAAFLLGCRIFLLRFREEKWSGFIFITRTIEFWYKLALGALSNFAREILGDAVWQKPAIPYLSLPFVLSGVSPFQFSYIPRTGLILAKYWNRPRKGRAASLCSSLSTELKTEEAWRLTGCHGEEWALRVLRSWELELFCLLVLISSVCFIPRHLLLFLLPCPLPLQSLKSLKQEITRGKIRSQATLNPGCPAEDNCSAFGNADSWEGQVWNLSCYTFVQAWCSILRQKRTPVEKERQLCSGTFGLCFHSPRDLGFCFVLTAPSI